MEISIVTTPPLAVITRPQDTAVASSWRLPGFVLLSLVLHLAIVMGFLHAKPEPSLLMAGREGGVVAMTLLSVAESRLAAATAAPAKVAPAEAEPRPQPVVQAAAATVSVPDAVIPLRSAPPQKNRADQPARAEKAQTPPRSEKLARATPQNDERPVRQEKRVTPAAALTAPARETANRPVDSQNRAHAAQKQGAQAAQTSAVNGATSSTSAEKPGSGNSGNAAQGAGSSNNQNFKALHRRVNYPQRAKALGVEGRVRIKFDVTASGTVTNVRILSETPSGVFAAAIQPDITRWRYQTQQAVSDQVVSIVFKLNGQVQLEN